MKCVERTGNMIFRIFLPGKLNIRFFDREPGVLFGGRQGDIHYIGGTEVLPAPLELEKELEVINDLGTEYEDEAKALLIEHNLRLVVYIAKKFENTGVMVEDLISIGTIGLIKSINTFNRNKNIKLATYASRCIENEILMYLRSNKKRISDVYLNEPIGKDKDDNEVTLQEVLENNDRNVEDEVDLKLKIKQLYEKMKCILKDREKLIIELRFGLNGDRPKTQKEIAKIMNISRSYVSRIESKAISKLSGEIFE